MQFKQITIQDASILCSYLSKLQSEMSCDVSFVNLLIWQEQYGNCYAIENDQLFLQLDTIGACNEAIFALPIGGSMAEGIAAITAHAGGRKPLFLVQEGPRLSEFRRLVRDDYSFEELRSDFDYIYLQSDLANLKGRKYHEKRNHISAFSRCFHWRYETLTPAFYGDLTVCATRWYEENRERADERMHTEANAIRPLLRNADLLGLRGGAIFVGNEMAAFTLGSPINNEVFDIHIEKALSAYPAAYTVINHEFVERELSAYRYINREDDLGIEGLRRAKLSYHPVSILAKYLCRPKER